MAIVKGTLTVNKEPTESAIDFTAVCAAAAQHFSTVNVGHQTPNKLSLTFECTVRELNGVP